MTQQHSTTPLILAAILILVATLASADEPSFNRKEDEIYGRKHGTALTMDVFTPKKDAKGIGLIFVVSGGFFSSHEAINLVFVRPFIDRGFTVFAVVHGSQPRFTVPEIVQDMNRSVRFIRYHAREYGIDPDRIGIYGGSAGGHLSLMIGTAGSKGAPNAKDPVERESSRVQAVACFFPPTDLLNFGKPGNEMIHAIDHQPPFRAAFDYRELDKQTMLWVPITGDQRLREITRQISPITFVTPDDPPTFIIHGDEDTLVPLQQSELIADKFKMTSVEARLVIKKGAGHGWPGLDKDLIQFADWFDRHLKKPQHSESGVKSSSHPDLNFDRIVIDNQGPKNPWVKIVGDLDGDGLRDVVIGGQDGPAGKSGSGRVRPSRPELLQPTAPVFRVPIPHAASMLGSFPRIRDEYHRPAFSRATARANRRNALAG
jgi:acetyl esterase/lipase